MRSCSNESGAIIGAGSQFIRDSVVSLALRADPCLREIPEELATLGHEWPAAFPAHPRTSTVLAKTTSQELNRIGRAGMEPPRAARKRRGRCRGAERVPGHARDSGRTIRRRARSRENRPATARQEERTGAVTRHGCLPAHLLTSGRSSHKLHRHLKRITDGCISIPWPDAAARETPNRPELHPTLSAPPRRNWRAANGGFASRWKKRLTFAP